VDPVFDAFTAALRNDPANPLRALDRLTGLSPETYERARQLLEMHLRAGDSVGTPYVPDETDIRDPDSLHENDRVGPFRIVRELDSGGMATVYVAERLEPYRETVALKLPHRRILSEELRERFHVERQTLADLRHPFIVSLLDGGELEDGTPYAAMEFVQGSHVDEYAARQALDVHDKLRLLRRVCDAVAHVHAHGFVHRDLKPSNILVRDDGTPKLLDFGIAKLLASNEQRPGGIKTATGFRMMTPDYASPEQQAGIGALTPASDVYSLGLILCEVIAGARPDRAHAASSVPRNLPPDLEPIVSRMLRANPAARYQTVAEVGADIDRVLAGEELEPVPASADVSLDRPFAGRLGFVTVVSLAYAALCGIAIYGELAYGLDRYAATLLRITPVAVVAGGLTAPIPFWVAWRGVIRERKHALLEALFAHTIAAIALWLLLTRMLPSTAVVEAEFQTYTAQAAFLKSLLQYLMLLIPCAVLPFHFVLSAQRELRNGRHRSLLDLLSREPRSVSPPGTLYVSVPVLVVYVAGIAVWSLVGVAFLFNNLRPGPYMNLFIALVLARVTIWLGMAAGGVYWYTMRLQDLKRQALAA
jgi:hypothetical protein